MTAIDDFEPFGKVKELDIRFGEAYIGECECLLAGPPTIENGEQVDAEPRRVPELTRADQGAIVAKDSGIQGGGIAAAMGFNAVDVAKAEVFMGSESTVVGEGAGAHRGRRVDGRGGFRERFEHASTLGDEAVVEGVCRRIGDLDDVHLRLLFSVLGDEKPAFFVDAPMRVASDAALIDGGEGSSAGNRPAPLRVHHGSEWGIEQRRDVDTLQYFGRAAIARVHDLWLRLGLQKSWGENGEGDSEEVLHKGLPSGINIPSAGWADNQNCRCTDEGDLNPEGQEVAWASDTASGTSQSSGADEIPSRSSFIMR